MISGEIFVERLGEAGWQGTLGIVTGGSAAYQVIGQRIVEALVSPGATCGKDCLLHPDRCPWAGFEDNDVDGGHYYRGPGCPGLRQ